MRLKYFRFPRGLLHAKPRFTKLQICLYAIIDSECRSTPFKWIPYNPKILQKLARVIVRSSVHEDSIERAVIELCRRKWIKKKRYLPDGSIILEIPEFRRRMLFTTDVPLEAMANPKLSYTAKLTFGALHGMLREREKFNITNKQLTEEVHLRERSLDSAIPELTKKKYIFIRNAGTRWREIRLDFAWDMIHTEHKENYESIRPRNRKMWFAGAKSQL